MKADDIIEIIDKLPEYIKYIYPGYLTIYTYYFMRGKTLQDNRQTFIKSIMLSYIYVTLTAFMPVESVIWANIGYIVLAIAIAYIGYRLTRCERVAKLFKALKIYTTFFENDVEALAGFDNGAWLIVYLKSSNIAVEGSLGLKELEDGKDKFITLDAYSKYAINEDGSLAETPFCCYENNYDEQCVIKYDDIQRIEKRATEIKN